MNRTVAHVTMDATFALEKELASYYQSDELRSVGARFRHEVMPELAWASSVRLARDVGANGVPTLVETLRAMRDDPAHPMVDRASGVTNLIWSDDPESWETFQALMDTLVENLLNPRTA